MDRSLSGTLSGTLKWQPERHLLRWADTPEEVTPWDAARGGGGVLPLELASLERIKQFIEGGDIDPPLQPIELLGGGKAPPDPQDLEYHYPPYPRLTRVCPYDLSEYVEYMKPIKGQVSLAIGNLRQHLKDEKAFRQEVLSIVESFAPLAFGRSGLFRLVYDTLGFWRKTAIEIGFYLDLASKVTELLETGLDEQTREAAWQEHVVEWVKKPEHDQVQDINSIREGGIMPLEDKDRQDLVEKDSPLLLPPKQFLRYIQRVIWLRLITTSSLKELGWGFVPGQFTVRCGSLVWAYYELWDTFRRNRKVKACLRCGKIFTSVRSDAETCSQACKKWVTRHREKGMNL